MSGYIPNPRLKVFWDTEVSPVITQISQGSYPLPVIQSRYSLNYFVILDRYGTRVKVHMYDKNSPDRVKGSKMMMPFASSLDKGQPEVHFFLPDIELIFNQIRASHPSNFRQVFQNYIVIGLIHELDHLAYSRTGEAPDSLDKLIEDERVAWAETCQETIEWFVNYYGQEISYMYMKIYRSWVKCGRNVEGAQWMEFMRGLYGSFPKKKKK